MKIQTLIIAGAAMFALLAPTAGAAGNRSVRHATPRHHVSTHHVVSKSAKKAKKVTTIAKSKPEVSEPRTVPYIYMPGPINPSVYVDPNECEDTGNNCTDQQACEFWGANCDSSTTDQGTTAPAAPAGSSASDPSDAPSPADTSASSIPAAATELGPTNCDDYNDYLATNDPSYC